MNEHEGTRKRHMIEHMPLRRSYDMRIFFTGLIDNPSFFMESFTFLLPPCNLISISSFTSTHSFSINFYPTSWLIQDQAWGMMIGNGELKNSLYILDTVDQHLASVLFFSSKPTSNIWHMRLGHPSYVKLLILHDDLNFPLSLPGSPSHCHKSHVAK